MLEFLRLGAYQALYMRSVPGYAAVFETVDQVRAEVGVGAGRLANAVLRRVSDEGDGIERFPPFAADPTTFLETWGSHPRWLVERWLARWSATEVRTLVEADNRIPALYVTTLDRTLDEAIARLAAARIEAEPAGAGSRCVRILSPVPPSRIFELLPDSIVQDPAANLVSMYADVPQGTKVADLCAAPGGKALAVADRASYTLASDRSEARLRMVIENARRTGRTLGFAVSDARRPALREADVVLLDVPCTGTGTLSRRPDARWRLEPGDIDVLTALQGEMLTAAAELLPVGGLLVYSTCSLEREENDERIDAFLAERPEFVVESTDAVPREHLDSRGCLFVTPQGGGFDGAFAARMRRVA